eukprot:13017353-Alexandrium_andersonii.AAC.1
MSNGAVPNADQWPPLPDADPALMGRLFAAGLAGSEHRLGCLHWQMSHRGLCQLRACAALGPGRR